MSSTWEPGAAGVLELPSGRLVRGRGLRHALPEGPRGRGLRHALPEGPPPDFAVHLLGRRPPPVEWEARWVRWPDFRLPSDRTAFAEALAELWRRAPGERVEVACGGGFGRTGTALACLAALDGVPGGEAVGYVRAHYSRRAVETPWQRRFVTVFARSHRP